VRDFEWLTNEWETKYSKITAEMLPYEVMGLGSTLEHECDLAMSALDSAGSKFFKTVYNNTPRIIGRK
jgi:hypothetical protein